MEKFTLNIIKVVFFKYIYKSKPHMHTHSHADKQKEI